MPDEYCDCYVQRAGYHSFRRWVSVAYYLFKTDWKLPTENIYIAGSVNALENWSPDNALLLSAANYPTWSITVNLPASTAIQYKYIRKNNGDVTWESDPNMSFMTPASGTYSTDDTWR